MDLAAMRAAFQRHTSGLATSMTASDIDGYLNNMYAEFLPGSIDGKVHEVTWFQQLVVNVNPIALPNRIVGFPTGKFWLQGTGGVRTGAPYSLDYYDDLTRFLLNFPEYQNTSNTGRPQAVFRQGRVLYFDRFPDATYNLLADARGGPSDALTTDGLPFNHAMAVVTAAAWNYLLEQEDEVGIAREATQYETWKGRLLREGHIDLRNRTPNRSF